MAQDKGSNGKEGGKKGQVIDFRSARDARIEERRRKYERVLFRNILGAYCVMNGGAKLDAVELVDASREGISFQLPLTSKNLSDMEHGKEMSFRLYFSQEAFLTLGVRIVNKRDCIEGGVAYARFGCAVDTAAPSYDTFLAFVNFLTSFAETGQMDTGGAKLSYF